MEKPSIENLPISLIIPYYNESSGIHLTMERILNQTCPPNEVIFVNSSSTDNCSSILDGLIAKFQGQKNIKFVNIFLGTNTPSSSKNAGVRAATQEWFAFMDCGLKFPANWLESMWNFLKKNQLTIASAVGVFKGNNVIDKCAIAQTYGYLRERATVPSTVIHKTTFFKVGFFEENRRAGYDIVWQKSIYENKIERGINRDIVFHYDGTNFGGRISFIIKKMILYSAPTVALSGYWIPYYYLIVLLFFLISLFVSWKLSLGLVLIYFFLRGFFIPTLKSKSIKVFTDSPWAIVMMPIVGAAMDTGRVLGILKGIKFYYFENQNK